MVDRRGYNYARDRHCPARKLDRRSCESARQDCRATDEFLQRDYYTDIITFDYTRGRRVSGDMFISLDTVRSNAGLVGQTYERELHRVIIHGILHLCGIDDKGPGEREIMESHEEDALAILGI